MHKKKNLETESRTTNRVVVWPLWFAHRMIAGSPKETIFVCLVTSEEAALDYRFARYDMSQLEPSDEQTSERACDHAISETKRLYSHSNNNNDNHIHRGISKNPGKLQFHSLKNTTITTSIIDTFSMCHKPSVTSFYHTLYLSTYQGS